MSTKEIQLFHYLLVLICLVSSVKTACNVCNPLNNLACYSDNQVQACDANNLPTRIPFACPTDFICVDTPSGVQCVPEQSGFSADCQECNKCDRTGTFACTGTSSFALCLGTNVTQNSVGQCAPGYVCNNNITQICGLFTQVNPSCSFADDVTTSTTTTTIATPMTPPTAPTTNTTTTTITTPMTPPTAPTTSTTTTPMTPTTAPTPSTNNATTTTTVAPTTSNPNAFCSNMQSQDYFPVGTNPTSTCRQYVYCFLQNGIWSGRMYTCPGSTFYDSSSKRCVTQLPATCTNRVASLSLNGIDLN